MNRPRGGSSGHGDRRLAAQRFGAGHSAFLIAGSWYEATLSAAPRAKEIGFTTLTPPGSATPVAMGGGRGPDAPQHRQPSGGGSRR